MPQKVLLAFLSLFFVWVCITGFDMEEIALGIVASGLIALISSREFIKGSVATKFHPRRWVMFVIFLIVFLVAEVYSHLTLAIKIFSGDAQPKVFILKSKFRSPLALTTLGNSITLTPGTLTLDVKGNKVVTYRLNPNSERVIKIFEAFLEGIFT